MDGKVKINLLLAGKRYPMVVPCLVEALYRAAGKLVNQTLDKFASQGYDDNVGMILTASYLSSLYCDAKKEWSAIAGKYNKPVVFEVISDMYERVSRSYDVEEKDYAAILAFQFAISIVEKTN